MAGKIRFNIGGVELGPLDLGLEVIHRMLMRLTLLNPRLGLRVAETYGRWGGRLFPPGLNPAIARGNQKALMTY